MVYAKVTELSNQYMTYNAVKNERKWEDKEMDCDNQELEATKKNREKKCKHCEKGVRISENNREELGIELNAGLSKLVAYGLDKYGWDIGVECNINYCPMCR